MLRRGAAEGTQSRTTHADKRAQSRTPHADAGTQSRTTHTDTRAPSPKTTGMTKQSVSRNENTPIPKKKKKRQTGATNARKAPNDSSR